MAEIQIRGLNARQQVLADIMWSIPEWADVERFMATLPARERIECEGIIECMKLALVEEYAQGMKEDGLIDNYPAANQVIDKILKR